MKNLFISKHIKTIFSPLLLTGILAFLGSAGPVLLQTAHAHTTIGGTPPGLSEEYFTGGKKRYGFQHNIQVPRVSGPGS